MISGRLITKWNNTDRIALYFWPVLLFMVSFCYFFWFGNGIFFVQEKKILFIFSQGYLNDFIIKPGSLLEYAGNFFTQAYFSKVYGSLTVSFSLLLFCALFIRINKLLSDDNSFSVPLVLIPSCLLLLIQVREDHFIHHTIGLLLTSGFYLVAIILCKRRIIYLILILFPLFFYLTGSFAFLFLLMSLVHFPTSKNSFQKYLYTSLLGLTAIVAFYVFKEILFLQPAGSLLRYPFNVIDIDNLSVSRIMLIVYMVLFPYIVKITWRIKTKEGLSFNFSRVSLIILFSLTIFFLAESYDSERRNDLQIEELFYEQNWEAVIVHQEKYASKNEISQYYYNLSLTEKGELCDRLFHSCQDYGIGSLVLPRKHQYLSQSVYFYYFTGLINEAHHLAYESMVIDGYSPEILKILIKTDLINGNFKIAERNINILKNTLHYRNWAIKYEKMLYNPENVLSDHELGEKIKLMPVKDFFISASDEENIDLLIVANPDNKKIFECKMAFLLLKKEYMAVMYQVKRLKDLGYTRIPRHIEESMVMFIDQKFELPYLGDLTLSFETLDRFSLFQEDLRKNKGNNRPGSDREMMHKWGNTFWYYYEFN